MTRIKVCGVTLADDAARASAAGVDYLGLNFWPRSKRYLTLERAPLLASAARAAGEARLVGVFVDPDLDEVERAVAEVGLDVIQLHGDEGPELVGRIARAVERPVWKAIPVASADDLARLEVWPAAALLLDAPTPARGGVGARFDWSLARRARERFPALNLALAGGLTPDNVAEAIAAVGPWAVDVASGIEAAPGVKDAAKLAAFVAAVRGAR